MHHTIHNPLNLEDITHIVDQGFRTMFAEWKFWFVAELSQIKTSKGKYYLDLVQFDQQQAIVAKCRAIIFQATILNKLIQSQTISSVYDLKGAKLLMQGVCNFHYEYGFSIIIHDISNEYLVGQFEQHKQDNLKLLQKLGIIDANLKTKLGYPPYRIAIISSATSEGLKDFMTILDESGYQFETNLYPTMIHGNDAKIEVYQNLKTIYQDIKSGVKIDLVAIIRGGGGSHGIMWQNDINIAKGICYMPVPVMIAIGHTSDQFLLHQLCRYPAKTPSDGAHILVDLMHQHKQQINHICVQINQSIQSIISNYYAHLVHIQQDIDHIVSNKLTYCHNQLQLLASHISNYDPQVILAQGYAILKNGDHQIIRDTNISNIQIGDNLEIYLSHHQLTVQVRYIKKRGDV